MSLRVLFTSCLVLCACGGIAVVDDGAGGASTTASSGATGSTKCVLGSCGDSCIRCVVRPDGEVASTGSGQDCKPGRCDKSLMCVASASPPVCN